MRNLPIWIEDSSGHNIMICTTECLVYLHCSAYCTQLTGVSVAIHCSAISKHKRKNEGGGWQRAERGREVKCNHGRGCSQYCWSRHISDFVTIAMKCEILRNV